jgi:hypothetical protein
LRSNKLRFACGLAREIGKISQSILPRAGGLKNVPLLYPHERCKVRGKCHQILLQLNIGF